MPIKMLLSSMMRMTVVRMKKRKTTRIVKALAMVFPHLSGEGY